MPRLLPITKTCLYNFDPLRPHFYIVKLGFTGVQCIHYFSYYCIKHRLWYWLEPSRRGGSNEYPQFMFWAEIWKISEFFYLKNFSFLEVKLSIYLNRRVFVMQFSASLVVDINSLTEWHTVQIQISWLQKPTALDLHCLQRQDISGFSRTRVKEILSVSLSSLYVFITALMN